MRGYDVGGGGATRRAQIISPWRPGPAPAPKPITYKASSNTPSWWKGWTPEGQGYDDPNAQYKALVNALIPHSSPEEQTYYANYLYSVDPTSFAEYKNVKVPPPTEVGGETQKEYFSADRALSILTTLSNMQTALGRTDEQMGQGFLWLKRVARSMGTAPTGQGMTRAEYQQMMGQVEPLLGEAKTTALAPYATLGKSIYEPYFSAGSIVPKYQTSTGAWVWGKPQGGWF